MNNLILNLDFHYAGLISKLFVALGACILKTDIQNINSFKIIIMDKRFPNKHVFDYIYDWTNVQYTKIVNFTENDWSLSSKILNIRNVTENKEHFEKAHTLIKKNIIKSDIMERINKQIQDFNISDNTLGVHFRLTDMNKYHSNAYGYMSYEDFLTKIKEVLTIHPNIQNIFIASDNHDSIKKLKQDLKDVKINYIKECIRENNETSEFYEFQLNNLTNEQFIVDSFIDMYLLSKCGYFIHRISGFAACSIIYSDSIKEIYTL